MIAKETIEQIANEKLTSGEIFLVDIKVSRANCIEVFIDSERGINIADCADLSRFIEERLDREREDFELNVSSAGLDQPLKVVRQYHKNIGREVKVRTKTGVEMIGTIVEASETEFIIERQSKEKDSKGKRVLVTERDTIAFADVQSTKLEIKF